MDHQILPISGTKWNLLSQLLILDAFVGDVVDGEFAFYAIDPFLVFDKVAMEESLVLGKPFPVEDSSIKYMTYLDGPMDVFIVLDRADWDRINGMVTFRDKAAWPTEPPADLKDRLEEALYDRNNPASPADAYDIFKAWCSENGIKAPALGQVAGNVV